MKTWVLAGLAGAGTILTATLLLPAITPKVVLESPIAYGLGMASIGTVAGIGFTALKLPVLAVGVGMPLFALGLFTAGVAGYARLTAPAQPQAQTMGRAPLRDLQQRVQYMPGPSMGAVEAWKGARNQMGNLTAMGAVTPYTSIGRVYPTMGAIEALVGDHRFRPTSYDRIGDRMGAR